MCCRRQQNFRFRTIRNNACPGAVDAPRFFNNARHRRRRRRAPKRKKTKRFLTEFRAGERAYPFLPLNYSGPTAFYRSILPDCCYGDAARCKYVRVEDTGFYGWHTQREDERVETRATDSAQQVAPLPRAFSLTLSRSIYLSLSLSLYSRHTQRYPHLSVLHLSWCGSSPLSLTLLPAFCTFVNVLLLLSSVPLAMCIFKCLITRNLIIGVIYNFRYIIRSFAN